MMDMDNPSSKTTIAPEVLRTIARLTTLNVEGVSRLAPVSSSGVKRWLKSKQASEGIEIEVTDDMVYADLYVVLKSSLNVREVSRNIQRDVARAISEMVGMQVGQVNIHIEDIDYPFETS